MYSVLYVDDEIELLEIGRMYLEEEPDIRVETAGSALSALEMLSLSRYDVIVSDYMMPRMNGISFLKEVRLRFGDVPFILFTGRGREEVVIDAINNGADFFLQKGGEPDAQFAELAHKIRKSAEIRKDKEVARESEQRLADIINFLPDATFAIDTNGDVIAWNRAIEDMTGIPPSDMLGKGNYEYALPFYGKRRPVLINLVLDPGEAIEETYQVLNRGRDFIIAETVLPGIKGEPVYVLGKASLLYDRNGAVAGAIESIRDISEAKLAEKTLKESEELFRTLFNASPDGIIVTDPDGTIIYASSRALEQAGVESLDMVKGTNVFTWLSGKDSKKAREALDWLKCQGGVSRGREYLVERRDGTVFPAAINTSLLYASDGGIRGIIAIVRDISEQKQTERILQESEEKFRTLIEQSLDGIIIIDFAGVILFANPTACRIIEIDTCQEILGKSSIFNHIPPEEKKPALNEIERVKGGVENYLVTFQLTTTSGRRIWIECIGKNVTFDEKPAIFISFRDITSRKMAEDALRNANQKLNILSSITRHDIVNELVVLDGFAAMLAKKLGDNPEALTLVGRIRNASRKIGDQIRFTKDYQDLGVNEPVWQNLGTMVQAAAHDTLPGSVELVVDTGDYEVFADPMLMLVFYNLFDNVKRHGETAQSVNVSFAECAEEGVLILEDDGQGIPDDQKECIFEKGVGKNTGYGLFLAREILAITGISIAETGAVGAGARFEIRVPKGRWRRQKDDAK